MNPKAAELSVWYGLQFSKKKKIEQEKMSASPLHLPPTGGMNKGKEKSSLQQRDDQINSNIPKTPDAKDIIRGFVKTNNDNEPPKLEQKGTPQFFQMKNNVPVAASPVKKTLTIASEPLKEQATQSPRIDKSQSQSQDKDKEKTPRKSKGGENSPAPVVQRIDSVPTSVQRVSMKKAKYTASLTWFERSLIMLNIVIFLGILFTLIILVRIFAVVHQKDINDFFAYLVSLN
jgi:hypothetical protein